MKASFSVSTQSILKWFLLNFVNPIFQSFGSDPENFVKKYCIVQKLDYLKFQFINPLTYSILFSELHYMSNVQYNFKDQGEGGLE